MLSILYDASVCYFITLPDRLLTSPQYIRPIGDEVSFCLKPPLSGSSFSDCKNQRIGVGVPSSGSRLWPESIQLCIQGLRESFSTFSSVCLYERHQKAFSRIVGGGEGRSIAGFFSHVPSSRLSTTDVIQLTHLTYPNTGVMVVQVDVIFF
jgi:hypothetical protein